MFVGNRNGESPPPPVPTSRAPSRYLLLYSFARVLIQHRSLSLSLRRPARACPCSPCVLCYVCSCSLRHIFGAALRPFASFSSVRLSTHSTPCRLFFFDFVIGPLAAAATAANDTTLAAPFPIPPVQSQDLTDRGSPPLNASRSVFHEGMCTVSRELKLWRIIRQLQYAIILSSF